MTNSTALKTATIVIIASTTVATLAVLLHRRVIAPNFRSVHGLLRYCWVGDHLPPDVRKSMDALDDVDEKAEKAEEELERIEEDVERAILDSVDGPRTADAAGGDDEAQGFVFRQNPRLRTLTGGLSHRLDALAADVDSIRSRNDMEVRSRKKELSRRIVRAMEHMDGVIARCHGNSKR